MAKKITSMMLVGEQFLLIDNVTGFWKSPVISGLLTSGIVQDRLLGGNTWFTGSARMTVCATANNASLDRDLARRFLRIRIDPGMETPQLRNFSFHPVKLALQTRMAIARAVLLLIRGHHKQGAPKFATGDAGFGEWSRLIRDCVMWIGDSGLATAARIEPLNDPATSISGGQSKDDPDTEAHRLLLKGLYEVFGDQQFYARDVVRVISQGDSNAKLESVTLLQDTLKWLLPKQIELSTVSMGRLLNSHRDNIIGDSVLRVRGTDGDHVKIWQICRETIAPT